MVMFKSAFVRRLLSFLASLTLIVIFSGIALAQVTNSVIVPIDEYWGDPTIPSSGTVTLKLMNTATSMQGSGTVTIEALAPSQPPRLVRVCTYGETCEVTFNAGEQAKLTAQPDAGSLIYRWSISQTDIYVPYYLYSEYPINSTAPVNSAAPAAESTPRSAGSSSYPCFDNTPVCTIALPASTNVTPTFAKNVNADLVVSALEVTPTAVAVGGQIQAEMTVKNMGTESSFPGQFTFSMYNERMDGPARKVWSSSYSRPMPAVDPGTPWTWTTVGVINPVLPFEGKFLIQGDVATPIETNRNNNSLGKFVYVTGQPTAVVQGSILQLNNRDRRRMRISDATLVLTGPESRTLRLSADAQNYQFSNLKLGLYTLKLKSRDYEPAVQKFEILSSQDVKIIDVGLKKKGPPLNRRPVAVGVANPPEGDAKTVFTLDASGSSDPDRDPLRYIWSFSPYIVKEGTTITHTFNSTAWTDMPVEVQLTVVDPLGASATTMVPVTVHPIVRTPVTAPTRIPVKATATITTTETISP